MIEFKTHESKELSASRAPIDIICVIDDSGSMSG
jgi:Mg-chelatase subunit ChlD